jgi:hypothetical protein
LVDIFRAFFRFAVLSAQAAERGSSKSLVSKPFPGAFVFDFAGAADAISLLGIKNTSPQSSRLWDGPLSRLVYVASFVPGHLWSGTKRYRYVQSLFGDGLWGAPTCRHDDVHADTDSNSDVFQNDDSDENENSFSDTFSDIFQDNDSNENEDPFSDIFQDNDSDENENPFSDPFSNSLSDILQNDDAYSDENLFSNSLSDILQNEDPYPNENPFSNSLSDPYRDRNGDPDGNFHPNSLSDPYKDGDAYSDGNLF